MTRQIVYTFKSLEESTQPIILIAGAEVEKGFIARYVRGDYNNGAKKMIGGIERIVFHMRHMEHTWRWATREQLRVSTLALPFCKDSH